MGPVGLFLDQKYWTITTIYWMEALDLLEYRLLKKIRRVKPGYMPEEPVWLSDGRVSEATKHKLFGK